MIEVDIDFSHHVVIHDEKVIPWLSHYIIGQNKSKMLTDKGGLRGVADRSFIRVLVPQNIGVTSSFFRGFFSEIAERHYQKTPNKDLSEIIKVVEIVSFQDLEAANRFRRTKINFDQVMSNMHTYHIERMLLEAK